MADLVDGAEVRPHAVLIDREVLLVDGAVAAGAAAGLERLRREQIAVAVLCDGSGGDDLERLLGQVGPVVCCPHSDADGCLCRRPAPGLLLQAAAMLSVVAADCAVLGSSSRDAEAAASIGARCVVVTPGQPVDAALTMLLPAEDREPDQAGVASPPADEVSSPSPSELDIVPLVLMGARRLPASAPWSAGVIG